jgi:hypothetical protein
MLKRAAMLGMCLILAGAQTMAEPEKTVLQVTGQIAGGTANLDMDALQNLPTARIETSTVVTDGMHVFTGFLMRYLLDWLEADGDMITAIALNDYIVDIPISDFHEFDVIVAYSMNGVPLRRDDKGPLWIIYPRDDHEILQDIRYDYRWVWQLNRLDVQ